MHFLGKYRVVRFEPGQVRLEKSDPWRALHVAAVVAVLAFIPLAAVLPSDWVALSALPSFALLFFGLVELGRKSARGVLTVVARSIALETAAPDYRGAPQRFVVLDGRRVPLADVRGLRIFKNDMKGRGPDIHALYLVTRGEAFRLESSPDNMLIHDVARTLADAFQIPPPEPLASREPISGAAVGGVFAFIVVELASGALLAAMPGFIAPRSTMTAVTVAAAFVALRLAVHFGAGVAVAALVRRGERARAVEMFGAAFAR